MLQLGKCYYRNDGTILQIGGRIHDYSREMPYVWSTKGDWYDEKSGAFVGFSPERGHYLWPVNNWQSISQHRIVKEEDE